MPSVLQAASSYAALTTPRSARQLSALSGGLGQRTNLRSISPSTSGSEEPHEEQHVEVATDPGPGRRLRGARAGAGASAAAAARRRAACGRRRGVRRLRPEPRVPHRGGGHVVRRLGGVQLQHRRPRARRERRRRLPPPEAQGGPRRAGPRRQRVGPRQRGARRQRRGAVGEPARRRAVRGAAAHRALRGGRARAVAILKITRWSSDHEITRPTCTRSRSTRR